MESKAKNYYGNLGSCILGCYFNWKILYVNSVDKIILESILNK